MPKDCDLGHVYPNFTRGGQRETGIARVFRRKGIAITNIQVLLCFLFHYYYLEALSDYIERGLLALLTFSA